MNKKIIITLTVLLFKYTYSQVNLVPNPGFEIYDTCPYSGSQIQFAKRWFSPTTGTPDYYNACASPYPITPVSVPSNAFGSSFAHAGNGMAGFYCFDPNLNSLYREYVSIRLTSPLVNNEKYFVSFFVKLPDSIRYATNRLHAYFGDTIHKNSYDTINVIPQVASFLPGFYNNKSAWTKVKGSFIAQGTKKFIYLGYFKHPFTNDSLYVGGSSTGYYSYHTCYYYLDDVCVTTDSLYNENWGVGIQERQSASPVRVFPTIIEDYLYFENINSLEKVRVYSTYAESQNVSYLNNSIDFTNLKSGIYFILINTDDKKIIKFKVIKQ